MRDCVIANDLQTSLGNGRLSEERVWLKGAPCGIHRHVSGTVVVYATDIYRIAVQGTERKTRDEPLQYDSLSCLSPISTRTVLT